MLKILLVLNNGDEDISDSYFICELVVAYFLSVFALIEFEWLNHSEPLNLQSHVVELVIFWCIIMVSYLKVFFYWLDFVANQELPRTHECSC